MAPLIPLLPTGTFKLLPLAPRGDSYSFIDSPKSGKNTSPGYKKR